MNLDFDRCRMEIMLGNVRIASGSTPVGATTRARGRGSKRNDGEHDNTKHGNNRRTNRRKVEEFHKK